MCRLNVIIANHTLLYISDYRLILVLPLPGSFLPLECPVEAEEPFSLFKVRIALRTFKTPLLPCSDFLLKLDARAKDDFRSCSAETSFGSN